MIPVAESVIKKSIYKNTGNKSVSNAVTISDPWSEADVVIRVGGAAQSFTTHVLRGVNGVYNIGSGPVEKCTASISVNGNTFTVTSVWWYAVDRMSDSTFVVYYR